MKFAKYLIPFFSLVIVFSCQQKRVEKEQSYLSFSKNILDYKVNPTTKFDKSGLVFSDQGSWFGFGISKEKLSPVGFKGPFLMTQQNGIWLCNSFVDLTIKQNNNFIDLTIKQKNSFSSHLEQHFIGKDVFVSQELVFKNGHTALIHTKIKNTSHKNISLELNWNQTPILADGISLTLNNNQIQINSTKTSAIGYVCFLDDTQVTLIDSLQYSAEKNIRLKPNQTEEILISQTFIFPKYSWEKEEIAIKKNHFNSILKVRKQEKEKELASLIRNIKPQFQKDIYAGVLAKSHLTLQNNWRISAGEIKYQGLFPSYHYKWFHGFWAWDSWKHAFGLSYYHSDLAKNQVQLMFEFQEEDGFVADCVFRDTIIEKHNYRNTKPPLSAWAVAKIFEKEKNIEFLKYIYPKLKKYHAWWYQKRDHDKDGICEYGSTDGSLLAAKWESGMDNAIRFDNSKMLYNTKNAYSLNQESVDLNAYLYAEKKFLSNLALALNLVKESKQFASDAFLLKQKIQTQFYDTKDGWFYDTSLDGKTFIKGEGSEGWIALWAKVASQKQANAVRQQMMNPKKFYTKVPFQTMSAAHKKFNPLKGYWRGPNWLDQAYFGVKGLRNYGFNKEADKATIQILEGAKGMLEKGIPIYENYHPLTGKGLNAKNFSWSAAHVMMLLQKN